MTQEKFRYFAIFGAMRSGSNLLEQSLNQFSGIHCHGELFNPKLTGDPQDIGFGISAKEREASPTSVITAMIEAAEGRIVGFRLFQDHDPRVTTLVVEDSACAKIILERSPLDSFISLCIARKTDQWLLRDAPDRRVDKIIFDPKEYSEYLAAHIAYYDNLRLRLQAIGQTAYWIRYPEQKEVATLNGIASFLGVEESLKSLAEPIKRQNPELLADKVENYDEMVAFLNQQSRNEIPMDIVPNSARRASIPGMFTCTSQSVLFVPIPGGPNAEVLSWMQTINGAELATNYKQKSLLAWMEDATHPISLTAVNHPVKRAYSVFMDKIFYTGPEAYDVIREQLVNYFGVAVPEISQMEGGSRASLKQAGYGIGQHRAAFHGFLRFLKSNLAGQTSIRVDGLWAAQTSFLAGFNAVTPISVIAKDGQLLTGFQYIETMLGLPLSQKQDDTPSDHMFTLNEIYTRQTENLTRKAYTSDYVRFGFDPYQAALDA